MRRICCCTSFGNEFFVKLMRLRRNRNSTTTAPQQQHIVHSVLLFESKCLKWRNKFLPFDILNSTTVLKANECLKRHKSSRKKDLTVNGNLHRLHCHRFCSKNFIIKGLGEGYTFPPPSSSNQVWCREKRLNFARSSFSPSKIVHILMHTMV